MDFKEVAMIYGKDPRIDEVETIFDDNGFEVSPLDDDYEYWKSVQESMNNPLSDDYCKYDHD